VCLSVWPSVRPSVTSRCSTETAKSRTTQKTPHDSPETLVFWCRKSWQKSTGVIRNGGAKCRRGRLSAGAVSENLRISTRIVVNLARSHSVHVICLQHVRRDAVRRAGIATLVRRALAEVYTVAVLLVLSMICIDTASLRRTWKMCTAKGIQLWKILPNSLNQSVCTSLSKRSLKMPLIKQVLDWLICEILLTLRIAVTLCRC